ncbi:MAG TPA: hypothetical protein VGM88_21835 [Kofleriaceae bacterium]|jgi:hypothetical protein
MRRAAWLVLALAGAALVAAPRPAHAQIAAALGRPLPAPDMPAGTVSVRVIAGSPSKPVTGTEVTLVVNGTPRVARTDAAGRAIFNNLTIGATAKAKVSDDDGKAIESDEFPIDASTGERLLLSTKPFEPIGGGGGGNAEAPFAGGGGGGGPGMPEPRQLSGEPRPEQADAAGTITVRVCYDDFKDAAKDQRVTLVGYAFDDTVQVFTAKTDAEGRAVFKDLDRSGGTAYYASALIPRNGSTDRVVSGQILLDTSLGVRLVLSADKRASTAAPIDDLDRIETQPADAPATAVRVTLEGAGEVGTQLALYDAHTHEKLATGTTEQGAPDPTRVTGSASFKPDPAVPFKTVVVSVVGGAGSDALDPIDGVSVRISPVKPGQPAGPIATTPTDVTGTTQGGGAFTAQIDGGPHVAIVTINGRELASQAFDVGGHGGRLTVEAHWESSGKPEATLSIAQPMPDRVVYVEGTSRGKAYRSLPFPLLAEKGSHATLAIYPRTLLNVQLHASVEDQQLAVQGRFEVSNFSWAPFRAKGDNGLLVPLPHGFKGGIVFDPDGSEVAVAAAEGLRIVRPIPPGGRTFHAGFSLPVKGGDVTWNLDLPLGTFQSRLEIRKTPNMTLDTGGTRKPKEAKGNDGTPFYVMENITILPGQSMQMTLGGLPTVPAWRSWIPKVLGLLVVVALLAGLGLALSRRSGEDDEEPVSDAAREARKQQLLDELVALRRKPESDDTQIRIEAVTQELEQLW